MPQPKSYAVGERRHFIGGSDARIIMGQDEKALIRLWQEKRGEVGPSCEPGDLRREKPGLGSIRNTKITELSCATLSCEDVNLLRHRSREENRFRPTPRRGESFQLRLAKPPDGLFRNPRQLTGREMQPRRARSGSCPAKRGRLGTERESYQQFLLTALSATAYKQFLLIQGHQ
jgi:hypothetical protein